MTNLDSNPQRPTEIKLRKADKTLTVSFTNGDSFTFTAEYLRVESPSAEVQGHSPAERKVIGGAEKSAGLDALRAIRQGTEAALAL